MLYIIVENKIFLVDMMHLKWSKEPLVWIRFVDKSVCVWKTSSFLQMGFKLNGSTFLFLSGVRKSLICLSLFPHSNVLFATQLNITSSRLNILEVRRMLNVIKSIPICMVDALTGPKSWDIDNWSWLVVTKMIMYQFFTTTSARFC